MYWVIGLAALVGEQDAGAREPTGEPGRAPSSKPALSCGRSGACATVVVGNLAGVTVVDRDSGAALPVYYSRGEYWVAGRPGARYAIEVANRLGERLLAVTSVDGIDVLSGRTAGWDGGGYVFAPGERYQITGWRKSDREVAAFTFADAADSYAQRTGRPANVGVIGVAVFRELSAPAESARSAENAAAPPSPSADAVAVAGASDAKPSSIPFLAREPAAKLGTGHGGREFSHVERTEFTRMQSRPDEIIRIHYDRLDNLVALGVIPRPRLLMPEANPFPAAPNSEYVPDPPG